MKKTVIGILAHVDAGKTTCVESMLYNAGEIRKMGRVDNRDAFLDYDEQERDHGITIYAKEAAFTWKDTQIFVIDTPGHADFSTEMERSLQAIDLAVMLISGQDGVQSHTETIWNCLEHYNVPVIIFVNKMDISHKTQDELMGDLKKHCSDACINYLGDERDDELAMVSDEMLNMYMETGTVSTEAVQKAVLARQCFPCFFGSALKNTGIDTLMDHIALFSPEKEYPGEFGARVYKISRDPDGSRLTHIRITGGRLKVKEKLTEEDKADQIRLYNGRSYTALQEAEAGMICALKGPVTLEAGQGLGFEEDAEKPILNAYMNYRLVYPRNADLLNLTRVCGELAAEDPQLQITADEKSKEITVQIMGEMQMEVLTKKIFERTGIHVTFGTGSIIYRETIAEPCEGYGHFEPLRHYAEVHVRLEPLKRGKGILVTSECPTDLLPQSWQNSIVSALQTKWHKGVLTGSLLTDVKIVLTAGKGHLKHTEGGDFRQAACRAVRQGLMKTENILLEPYCSFDIRIPSESLGRIMFMLESKGAQMEITSESNGITSISGRGSLKEFMHFQNDVTAASKGRGRFTLVPDGYDICRNAEEVIAEKMYDPEADMRNPTGSVFCAHGRGFYVPWDEVGEHLHIDIRKGSSSSYRTARYTVSEEDMKKILDNASGRNRNENKQPRPKPKKEEKHRTQEKQLPPCLIVDGYNMIYSWDELKEEARYSIAVAREKLIEIIAHYQSYIGSMVILVFDGYKVRENHGSRETRGNLMIVYTREDETADSYIEKTTHDLRNEYRMTVATSDSLIQNAVFAHGGYRISARELKMRIDMMYDSFDGKLSV
ncbi:MAG: NYN domain-containing protein [Solobacterium sp.]|nr:NYN domain-containing protein [Solobacterium sp.]